jgi:CcmD family protein
MKFIRTAVLIGSLGLAAAPAFAQQQPPPSTAQSEYVPANPGTATEQLPAAPLVIAAYAFVWIATTAYVWTIWRRLGKVEDDLKALERKTTARTR